MRSRRAKGEGHIRPVTDDNGKIIGYEGSIEIDAGIGGKRRRRKATGKTKAEVAKKLQELSRQSEQGVDLGTKRQTVAQYLEHWLTDVVGIKNAPKTFASYKAEVINHINPHVGHIRLDQLTQAHVERMRNALQQTPQTQQPDKLLGLRQVEYAVKVLSRALNRAIKEKLIGHNPAALVEVPKATPTRHALTIEQAQAFLAALAGHPQEALYTALILTGMRKGEALALTWPDIDLDNREIAITKTGQRIHGIGRHIGTTKTKKGRVIAMPDVLVRVLERHRQRQEQTGTYSARGMVFPSTTGTLIESGNMHRQFKRLLAKAGLPADVTIHSLRHTCATLLLDGGESAVNVAAQLGHAKVSTTLDIYGHSVRDTQARGIEALARKLKGDGDES